MKKENIIIISLLAILVIVITSIFIRNYSSYKTNLKIASNPFNTIEVLDEKVRLKDNERTYSVDVDCSKIVDENTQIIYYQLTETHRKSTIKVESKILKDNEVLTTGLNRARSIDTIISVFDSNETYEQIYHINATCTNEPIKEEEPEEKKEDSNQTTTTKKNTKKTTSKK